MSTEATTAQYASKWICNSYQLRKGAEVSSLGSLPFVFAIFEPCRWFFQSSQLRFRSFLIFFSLVGDFLSLHISLSVRFWLFSVLSVIFSLSITKTEARIHRQKQFLSKTNGKVFSSPLKITDRSYFYQKRTERFFHRLWKSPTEAIFIKNERKSDLGLQINPWLTRYNLRKKAELSFSLFSFSIWMCHYLTTSY